MQAVSDKMSWRVGDDGGSNFFVAAAWWGVIGGSCSRSALVADVLVQPRASHRRYWAAEVRSPAATVVTAELFLFVGAVGLHVTSARPPRSCATPCSLLRSSSQRRRPSSSRTAARGHRRDLCRLKRADIAHSSFFCPSCRALRVLRVRSCIGSLLEPMGVSLLPRSPFRSPSNERTRLGLGSEQTNFLRLCPASMHMQDCFGAEGSMAVAMAVTPHLRFILQNKTVPQNFVSEMPR